VNSLIPALKLNGTVILVAVLAEPVNLNTQQLMKRNASLKVWTNTNPGEIESALQFAAFRQVLPAVELFPLEKAEAAFEAMSKHTVRCRAVIDIAPKTPKPISIAKKKEPKQEEPKKEEPKKDEPKKDELKKEEPKKEEPKKEEQGK
jgi:hypothetical protein